jgi:alpha(1,3/1,4) fucosyltransferase
MIKNFVSIFPGNVKSYLNNSVFDSKYIDEWNPFFKKLKIYLKKRNIELNTYDVKTPKPWKIVYFDLPYLWSLQNFYVWKMILMNKKNNILLCNETPIIIPYMYMKVFHYFFQKIYTWNDDWVDNKKYFKIRLPQNSDGLKTRVKKYKDKNFLVLINSNKSAFLPFKLLNPLGKELYSERIKAIEYFEKKIPEKFYLYGRGWNKPKKYQLTELLFGYRKYLTYWGVVKTGGKIQLISNFKYCICFENITDVKGYITEKIFDCFKAKCVPIYWGASNVEKYIPKDCFIDFRDFYDYGKLLEYLESIDEKTYKGYVKNIEKLLADKKFIASWFEDRFTKFFAEDVLEINHLSQPLN